MYMCRSAANLPKKGDIDVKIMENYGASRRSESHDSCFWSFHLHVKHSNGQAPHTCRQHQQQKHHRHPYPHRHCIHRRTAMQSSWNDVIAVKLHRSSLTLGRRRQPQAKCLVMVFLSPGEVQVQSPNQSAQHNLKLSLSGGISFKKHASSGLESSNLIKSLS